MEVLGEVKGRKRLTSLYELNRNEELEVHTRLICLFLTLCLGR